MRSRIDRCAETHDALSIALCDAFVLDSRWRARPLTELQTMFQQLLQRNADYHPDDTAIVWSDQRLSHAALLDRVERSARGLLNLGISAGDRVALLLENGPDFITGFFANVCCRAINVPLNVSCTAAEAAYYFDDSQISAVIVDMQHFDVAKEAARALRKDVTLIVCGDCPSAATSFASLSRTESDASLPTSAWDDDVVYMYTSGSTGRPKCIPRTHAQYWWEMDNVATALGLDRDDVIFCTIPLFHNFGAVQCMLAAVGSGARLVLIPNSNPFALYRDEVLRLLEKERVTVFPGVPFVFDQLVKSSRSANLSFIRACYSAAATLTEEIAVGFYHKFSIPIRQHYGCSEAGAISIDMSDEPPPFERSVGSAFPGVRVTIRDDSGQVLAPGEVGEVAVKGRQVMSGYRNAEQPEATFFEDGSFRTGDLGQIDECGKLYLVGRKKLIIDIMGQKVDPIEVENVLKKLSAVEDCVVVSAPFGSSGERALQAYVVAEDECKEEMLLDFCKRRLSHFKVPVATRFVDRIPRTAMGKVVRNRELLEQHVIGVAEKVLAEEPQCRG